MPASANQIRYHYHRILTFLIFVRLREAGTDLARRALEADMAGDSAAAASLREHAATVEQSVVRLQDRDS